MKRVLLIAAIVLMAVPVYAQRPGRGQGYSSASRPSTSGQYSTSGTREEQVNKFLAGLAASENVSALTRTPLGDEDMPGIIVNGNGEAFILTQRTVDIKDAGDSEIPTADENIFPGAIVYADNNLADGHPTLVGLSYGTVDLTISFDTGGQTTIRDVPNDKGTINDTRYEFLRGLKDSYAAPVTASVSEDSYTSTSKICYTLGVDANYLKNSVKVNTSTTNEESKIVKIADFTQKFYTISISPYDDQNLYKYFGNVTVSQLAEKLNGRPIAVISSVTYGRRIYDIQEYYSSDFKFTGDESVDVKVGGFGAKAKSTQDITQHSEGRNHRLQILGGSQKPAQDVMRGKTALEALAEEGALALGPANQGVPLSFTAQFLASRKYLTSQATGSYTETSYVKCPKSVRVKVKNTASTVPDGIKFRLFYNVIVVTGNARNGYSYFTIKGNGTGPGEFKDSFDHKYSNNTIDEYSLPHKDVLKGYSGITLDQCYVLGPVYYTIRSHTAAGQDWKQRSDGWFDISGGSLYVRMYGSALAGGKGVLIHSDTTPKPIGFR